MLVRGDVVDNEIGLYMLTSGFEALKGVANTPEKSRSVDMSPRGGTERRNDRILEIFSRNKKRNAR